MTYNMTDFDKLIKEKAEQAEYAYKPAAWKSFRQKAGMGRGTVGYWAAGVATTVIIGGSLVFMLNREPRTASTDSPTETSVIMADSSSENVQSPMSADTFLVEETAAKTTPATGDHRAGARERVQPAEAQPEQTTTVAKAPEKPSVTTPRYGRPLVIDVDTIKDNVPSDEELRNGHSRLY